ncbi:uncharacterized protein OCT59_026654 [Rhizophagus irregularis]|uniref:F-box domain-containing protein n=1 Tax=Rhizophagus irregularis (strain DAOM 197198w) TaxID=1432141 RepID=A0A015JLM1_RHIIW|nr:hypothetical protein RirG_221670 [Rhizophagus irregularis DAOM 197198w]UZO06328.1 hypothetical protein OCT59_026654 [Rhizophagus irregularis]
MVNRIWCKIVIPILWRNPWCYDINYHKKISLYSILTSYLSNDIKEFLTKKEILISNQSLVFDYLSFCKSIDTIIIDNIISIGTSSEYNQFLLQEEIYSFLIKKCPEIKYLSICDTHEILYLPEIKDYLESLCELTFDTLIDPRYFYKLANICQQIQRMIIINKNTKVNNGTTKLIELQKNLKYFKWIDDFKVDDGFYYWEILEDPYTEIFNMLEKHANTINHFETCLLFDYDSNYNNYDYSFIQYTLLRLHNLKILDIDSPLFLSNDDFNEKLEMVTYRDLEILKIDYIDIYQVTCIIKNCLYLKELRINDFHWNDNIIDISLNFIHTISENCFLIEYLTIPVFPLLENHFIEFEKLLKKCQNLRALYFQDAYYKEGRELEFGDYLLNLLVKEASTNLREIGISYDIRLSLKALELFFEKWKGRPAVSIYVHGYYFYRKNDSYMKIIDKYKIEGVIKEMNV